MALTPSGAISMSNLNTVLGRSATASISFNDSQVRWIANQATGAVTMNSMRNRDVYYGTITPGTVFGKGTDFRRGYFRDFSQVGTATGSLYGVSLAVNPGSGLSSVAIYGGGDSPTAGLYGRVEIYDNGTTIGASTIRLLVGSNTGVTMTDFGSPSSKLWGNNGVNPVNNTGLQDWTIVSP